MSSSAPPTLRSNDAPYGRFAISSPLVSVSSSLTRSLSFNVTRELGSMGTVAVEVSVVYDPVSGLLYLHSAHLWNAHSENYVLCCSNYLGLVYGAFRKALLVVCVCV